jgi:NhaP-type Na+/H+ and K+/H+ antiporter
MLIVSLENGVLCCALFTKPYRSKHGAVLLHVCVAVGMLVRSNGHLQISTVADRLSMLAICGGIP